MLIFIHIVLNFISPPLYMNLELRVVTKVIATCKIEIAQKEVGQDQRDLMKCVRSLLSTSISGLSVFLEH